MLNPLTGAAVVLACAFAGFVATLGLAIGWKFYRRNG